MSNNLQVKDLEENSKVNEQQDHDGPHLEKEQESQIEKDGLPAEEKDEAYYQKLMKQQEDEGITHLGRPFWLSKLIVRKTWLVLTITYTISIIFAVVALALGAGQLSPSNTRDYLVWGNKRVKDYDKLELATEDLVTDYEGGIQPLRTLTENDWATSVTYVCDDCDTILTVGNLKQMYEIEQRVLDHEDFGSFCIATSVSDSSCSDSAYTSIAEYFEDKIISNTLTQSDIDDFLNDLKTDDDLFYEYNIYMGIDFTQENLSSKRARAVFLFGTPIDFGGKRYESYLDDPAGQNEEFIQFSFDLEDVVKDYDTELDVDLYSDEWFDGKVDELILKDFILAALSFMFVMIYVSVHLGSAFLGGMSMLAIGISYPVTLFIMRFIFQITFFMSLNFSAIFVILGISADDVFVFTDAWNQTATYEQLNLQEDDKLTNFEKRMNYTWRRAFKSMLTTSCTSMLAFLATGFSKLMPISAFGFFSATLIFVNFVYANVSYPCFLILYEKYLKDRCKYKAWCKSKCKAMFKKCKKEKKSNAEDVPQRQPSDGLDDINNSHFQERNEHEGGNSHSPLEEAKVAQTQHAEHDIHSNDQNHTKNPKLKEESAIEKFFANHWNEWIFKMRIPILIGTAVIIGLSMWRASRLGPAKETIEWLEDDHPYSKLQSEVRDDYNKGEFDSVINVRFVWGIGSLSRAGTDKWDAADIGEITYDEEFDVTSEVNQQRIVDICNDLRSRDLVRNSEVTCWVEDFMNTQNGGNPISQADFYTELEDYIHNTDIGIDQFTDNLIGYISGDLKFIVISAIAVAETYQGYEITEPIYNDWEDLKDYYNENSPTGVNNCFQTAKQSWAFLQTEKEFVNGAIQGIIISLTFGFLIILISTMNVVNSIYSIICIGAIVSSVMAVIELMGWKLGILESVSVVIIIGFSIDYVVHLANHYAESVYDLRYHKMRDALRSIGISIISGAATTLGSGFFIFFAVVTIFTKYAVLIWTTIWFALFYALVVYTAINHLIGPQYHFGDIRYYIWNPLLNKLKQCCKKNDSKNRSDSKIEPEM